jgi:hypothetical protein
MKSGSLLIAVLIVVVVGYILILMMRKGTEGFAVGVPEVYFVSLITGTYENFDLFKTDFANVLGAEVATEAHVREAYRNGARWYKACVVADPSPYMFYTAQADGTDGSKAGDLITLNKTDAVEWKAGIALYGFKPSIAEFGDETITFKVWGFKEQVVGTITQKYQSTAATDADTLNNVNRLGYEVPASAPQPVGSSSSSAASLLVGPPSSTPPPAGSSSSSARPITMESSTPPPAGSSSSSALPTATPGAGTDIESIMTNILSRLGSERCDSTPRGRGATITNAAPSQNNVSLPPTQPSLNLTMLIQIVRNLGSSVQTTADSEVLARFIRHYGAQRRIPSDDTNSILIDYVAYPNFYENFYNILDDNNKRIFREYNFDIQAYLINIINQFNRDTMIALHYMLDPNFVVEDVADAAADAAAAGDSMGPADVYNAFKPQIIQDIRDAITRQLEEKCTASGAGAGGAAGAGAAGGAGAGGAGGAAGAAAAGVRPDAGSGSVPAYVPPAGGSASGSLPTIIPPTISGSQTASALTGSNAAAAAAAAAAARAGTSGTPACAPEACAAADACSPSLDQGSNWQYMMLPSAGAAKCGDTKKAAPSLIWGE